MVFESYRQERHQPDGITTAVNHEFVYMNLPKNHHVLRKVCDCRHCGALRFQFEGPAFCCRKGKVGIFTPDVPEELKRLLIKMMRMQNISESIYGISTPTSHSQVLESPLIAESALRQVLAYIHFVYVGGCTMLFRNWCQVIMALGIYSSIFMIRMKA